MPTVDRIPYAEPSIAESDPAALREAYLRRLERLLHLRKRHERELNRQGMRLLDHSVFSAYCDCRDVGAEQEARALLRELDVALKPPPQQLRLDDAWQNAERAS